MGKEEVLLSLSRAVRSLYAQQQVWALGTARLCSPRVSGH